MVSKTARDIILYGGLAAGVIGLGAYAITRIIPGSSSAQCTTPGSPCYSALQPLIAEFQTCASNYNSILQTCYHSSSPSTCISQNQSVLNNWKMCMDSTSSKIASTAKMFNSDPLATVFGALQIPIETAVVIYFGSKAVGYLKGLRTGAASGSETANNFLNGTTRFAADNGVFSPAEKANMSDTVKAQVSDNIATDAQYYDTLVANNVVSESVATEAEDAAAASMEEDATVTLDEWLA